MPIYIHIQWRCVSPKRLVVVLAGWLALALVYGGRKKERVCMRCVGVGVNRICGGEGPADVC